MSGLAALLLETPLRARQLEFAPTIRAWEKGLALVVHGEGGSSRRVRGDACRLRQVNVNMVGTEIGFPERGHVLVHASCAGAREPREPRTCRKSGTARADNPADMAPHVPAPGSPCESALRLAGHGEFAQAAQLLERALTDGACADERQFAAVTLAEVARGAESSGDSELAQRALESAVRAVGWADLHCELGCLLVRRGRRAEARAAFDRALALNPRYRTAVVERALLDARDGRIAEAMQTLRVLAAEGALAEPGAFQQGLDRLSEADFEDAAPLLRRALRCGDPWLEEQLRSYQELMFAGELPRALAVLRAAAAERPAYPDLLVLLGAHELKAGANDDAIESLTRALELNPDYHAARVELARAIEALGDTPQAIALLEQVLAADGAHPGANALRDRLASRRRGHRGVGSAVQPGPPHGFSPS